jgi:hypothetical protein
VVEPLRLFSDCLSSLHAPATGVLLALGFGVAYSSIATGTATAAAAAVVDKMIQFAAGVRGADANQKGVCFRCAEPGGSAPAIA